MIPIFAPPRVSTEPMHRADMTPAGIIAFQFQSLVSIVTALYISWYRSQQRVRESHSRFLSLTKPFHNARSPLSLSSTELYAPLEK